VFNQIEIPEIDVEVLYISPDDKHYWKLKNPVEVTLSNGDLIAIPKDFVTDFASVPRLLWSFIPPRGDHDLAALIHDYLYKVCYLNRLFADLEFLYWLLKTGNKRKKAMAMYRAVRIWGGKWWKPKK